MEPYPAYLALTLFLVSAVEETCDGRGTWSLSSDLVHQNVRRRYILVWPGSGANVRLLAIMVKSAMSAVCVCETQGKRKLVFCWPFGSKQCFIQNSLTLFFSNRRKYCNSSAYQCAMRASMTSVTNDKSDNLMKWSEMRTRYFVNHSQVYFRILSIREKFNVTCFSGNVCILAVDLLNLHH